MEARLLGIPNLAFINLGGRALVAVDKEHIARRDFSVNKQPRHTVDRLDLRLDAAHGRLGIAAALRRGCGGRAAGPVGSGIRRGASRRPGGIGRFGGGGGIGGSGRIRVIRGGGRTGGGGRPPGPHALRIVVNDRLDRAARR